MGKCRFAAVIMCLSLLGATSFLIAPAALAGGTKLRLATEAATPPLNYIGKDGRLTGFDVDIGNAICEVMLVECEWVVADWDELVNGLVRFRYDAVISSIAVTPKWREKVDFSDSYHLIPASFLGSETLAITNIDKETLKDKMIGVVSGGPHEAFLRDNFADIAAIKTYDLVAQATVDLIGGRLDLVFGDRIALENGFLKSNESGGFKLIGPSYTDAKWFGEGAGIAVRRGEGDLKWRFNAAIRRIRADDTYKKINDRYFDFDIFSD